MSGCFLRGVVRLACAAVIILVSRRVFVQLQVLFLFTAGLLFFSSFFFFVPTFCVVYNQWIYSFLFNCLSPTCCTKWNVKPLKLCCITCFRVYVARHILVHVSSVLFDMLQCL